MPWNRPLGLTTLIAVGVLSGSAAMCQQDDLGSPQSAPTRGDAVESGKAEDSTPPPFPEAKSRPLTPLPPALDTLLKSGTSLNPQNTVILDKEKNRLLLRTEVVCPDCLLEMFCCLEQTKEHESILALRSKAWVVHAGLLALGAEPGRPVIFVPEFKPPTGQKIDIFVNWVDEAGRLQRCDARKWMRHSVSRYYSEKLPVAPPGVKLPLMELRYDPYNKEILWFGQMTPEQRDQLLKLWDDKQYQAAIRSFFTESQSRPMTAEFVFAGSYQYTPEGSTDRIYAAEGGEVICVANFASSLIEVREASSAADGGQSYEAAPAQIPPRGTPVIMELVPAKETAAAGGKSKPE